jgi:hypothetical protein
MKRLLTASAIAAALLTGAPARAQEDVVAETKANCAAEWPGDYAMQRYCLTRHFEATEEILAITGPDPRQAPEHMREMLTRCMIEWPGETAGYNYPMVAYCFKRQLAAHDALQR